jgi:hypothetical protein
MGKKSGSESGSGYRMNTPDHISERPFWVKILKFFDADPGSGMEKIRIRYANKSIRVKHPRPATLSRH